MTPDIERMCQEMVSLGVNECQNQVLQFIAENTAQIDATTKLYIEEERESYTGLFTRLKDKILPMTVTELKKDIKAVSNICQ